MNAMKKILGFVWILCGVALGVYLPYQTIIKLSAPTASAEDFVFWIVIATIFTPIIIGFVLFGLYAVKGEYSEA